MARPQLVGSALGLEVRLVELGRRTLPWMVILSERNGNELPTTSYEPIQVNCYIRNFW